MLKLLLASLFAFTLVMSGPAAGVTIGDALPELEFPTQHDEARPFPGQARWILFTSEKKTAELADKALQDLTSEQMEALRLVYLMDISPMPSLVTRMFVLPKMRERAYPVLLARESGLTDFMPREADRITVIRLEEGRVESINFLSEAAQLRELIGIPDHR